MVTENTVGPVLHSYVGDLTDAGLDAWLREQGYYLFREFYHFGRCPTYRHKETGETLYAYQGYLWNWEEVAADLRENWRPAGSEERRWFGENLGEA